MQWKDNLTHLILVVVVLGLTLLMVYVDAQAQIVFASDRDGQPDVIPGWFTHDIFVMDVDGKNQRNLTNNPSDDRSPSWFNSPFSVSPVGKKFTMWGRLKQLDR